MCVGLFFACSGMTESEKWYIIEKRQSFDDLYRGLKSIG